MAFFGVTIEKIEKVWDHPNADRLSMAKAEGMDFQFVIGKNQFKKGDSVLYFPLDSLIPVAILEKMGMAGKLSGKDKNKIKTLKLRGEISQGLVFPVERLLDESQVNLSSQEITDLLGVTKYEPPVVMTSAGNLIALPDGLSKYDIEGADRYGHIVELLMDQEVVVMEKMEGTNFSVAKLMEWDEFSLDKSMKSAIKVNQRSNSIVEIPGHLNSYWQAARTEGLTEKVDKLSPMAAIYGELCGTSIQKNIYKLPNHRVYVFDIKENGQWLGWDKFKQFTDDNKILTAPILFVGKLRDFLNGKTVQEASNGKSVVNPNILREGIVIKPIVEQRHSELGRLIIKQRSPEYLAVEE